MLDIVLVDVLLGYSQVVGVNISPLFFAERTKFVIVNESILVLVQIGEDQVNVILSQLNLELFQGVDEVSLCDFAFLFLVKDRECFRNSVDFGLELGPDDFHQLMSVELIVNDLTLVIFL